MAIRRSLLHACALLAALAPAQEAGGLRVSIDAPWAERAQVASSAGRLWEVERSLGDAPERRIDLDLPAGFEYAFALVGKGGSGAARHSSPGRSWGKARSRSGSSPGPSGACR